MPAKLGALPRCLVDLAVWGKLSVVNRTQQGTIPIAASQQHATSTGSAAARFGKSAERRHPRFRTDFATKVFTRAEAYEGKAHDISEAGIALEIPVQFHEGEQISLQFTLPHSEWHFTVCATVKHSSRDRCGLEFHKLTRRESDELWRVCRRLAYRPEDSRLIPS